MKINAINNTNFGSKIGYNKTMQKGFELAKNSTDSLLMKDLNFAKDFSDNVRTVLNDKSQDEVSFILKPRQGIFTKFKSGEERVLNKSKANEGYLCTEALSEYSDKFNKSKSRQLETIKFKLDEALSKVDMLKQEYSNALKKELDSLENKVKNTNA